MDDDIKAERFGSYSMAAERAAELRAQGVNVTPVHASGGGTSGGPLRFRLRLLVAPIAATSVTP